MIELVSKDKCSGCSACYNACKFGALSMEIDETGFWFPHIDKVSCVECGACTRACPSLDLPIYKSEFPRAYIAQNTDDEIRKQSTSGGAFTAIAKQVIDNGGVVFGAAIDKEYRVSHICVDKENDLARFRSSKYVQSLIGDSFKEAKRVLSEGRQVCFSGTPCQIYGLKKYLGRNYNNLLTVDVMCRAVPSPKILEKYLEYQKERFPQFDRIVFRDKGRGYSYSGIAIYKGEKVLYRGGSESDPWLRLFLGGYCNREICHECPFQTGVRASDITLWDCWGTQNYVPEWDDNKGTTNVITWSSQGDKVLKLCDGLRCKEIGIEHIDASLERKPLHRPTYNRMLFFTDAGSMNGKEFINKYVPITFKIRIKNLARSTMYSLHLHDKIRKMVHKLRKAKKGMEK